ncbi:hypothetical protein K435DRAFT_521470 [Dendrothele bispora CBS 962.96]|uniref:Uncharacterized protein n=1 Tax=Dendrothele bispora (strain CBS 962.96) TaxID=1314807 RepID=A0A4S8MA34_DENBC|nr:hypothetical protein K435DRAFT_521470 [Dendrothele bispora CBS 962.96]
MFYFLLVVCSRQCEAIRPDGQKGGGGLGGFRGEKRVSQCIADIQRADPVFVVLGSRNIRLWSLCKSSRGLARRTGEKKMYQQTTYSPKLILTKTFFRFKRHVLHAGRTSYGGGPGGNILHTS